MDFGWISAGPPGDFEPQSAIMIGLGDFLYACPQLVVDVLRPLLGHVPIIGVVRGEAERRDAVSLLIDWGLSPRGIQFLFMPIESVWVRDYGPVFARWSDGKALVLDAEYVTHDHPNADIVPFAVATFMRLRVHSVPLNLEGGNLLGNGQGLCVFTSSLVERNAHHGYDQRAVCGILRDCYGFTQTVALDAPVNLCSTHVDMFATFTAPDMVVVGSFDRGLDPINAKIWDRNASVLAAVTLKGGRKLRVVRVPMPPPSGRCCRSYLNIAYANGRLLVPRYRDVDPILEREAFSTYRQLLPGWEIFGIDCSSLVPSSAGLHCITLNLPWLEQRFRWLGDREPVSPACSTLEVQ